jgi:pSer/pThr/pTyr-binding forkhead associated (FHA) protein
MSSPQAPASSTVEAGFGPAQAGTGLAAREGSTERVDAIACLDERVRHQALPARPTTRGRYIEVQGPGRETLLVSLDSGLTRIGRGLHADLRLDETSVSRRHAILVNRQSGVRLLDDRSSNGTFVNGRRITQAELRSGDVLVLGRVVLRYLDI